MGISSFGWSVPMKNREGDIYLQFGGLAHLARALAWQARGDRFESGILHKFPITLGIFYFYVLRLYNLL
jgi:hypothetical protein